MKRIVLFSALSLILGVAVLRLMQHDTGYVLIVVAGKSIEMRFWFAVAALITLVVGVFLCLRVFSASWRALWGGWSSFIHDRSLRARHRLEVGVLRLIEGDQVSADRFLQKAAKSLPQDALAAIASSEVALRSGRYELARKRLQKVAGLRGDKAVSIALAEVKIQLAEGRYPEALARLLVLKSQVPNNPTLLHLLQQTLLCQQDWPALEALLDDLDRKDVMARPEWLNLQKRVYRERLLQSVDHEPSTAEVQRVWERVPKKLKQDSDILAVYCRLMMGLDPQESHTIVEPLLLKAIKAEWNDELVELFGLVPSSNPEKQLAIAEKWLEDRDNSAVLLLALGRISLHNQLWGKAREYFQVCLNRFPSPVVYAELARLMASLGEHQNSIELYRQGLLQTSPKLPNLPMPQSRAESA